MQLSAKPCQPRSHARTVVTALLKVRPYTVRKGDTLDLIAEKRGEHAQQTAALTWILNGC